MARHVIKQAGAPSTVPPSVGAHYVDSSTGNLYLAKDTLLVSDWVLLATGGSYTDEQAQDAIGAALTDTASIDFTYNDVANQITAAVLPTGVNHDSLQNYVANKHVNHTLVSISAGTGLTGGGDITASRTLSLANTTVTAGTYGSASATPTVTVDAQGRLTAAANTPIQIAESQVTNLVTDLAAKVNTTTTLTAGTGLSGGGDLSTNRTISLANTAVAAGTYGSSTTNAIITVDAQGRLTSATTAVQDVGSVTGILPIANGGTGQSSLPAAFDALSPLTTTGDLLSHNGTDNVRLPVGSPGQVLTVSGSAPAWATPAGTPGPESLVQLYDDFPSATSSSTSALGWVATLSSGTITTLATPEPNTVGIINMATSTLITGRAAYSSSSTLLYFSAAPIEFAAYVRIPVLSTAAQRFTVYVGLGDTTGAGDMVDGAYFQYTDANSGGNWELKTSNNSVRTTVNSTVAATTRWTRLALSANAAGTSITFSINGTAAGTITTNIPNTAARATGLILKIESSAGTTSKSLYVDYVKLTSVVSR
jgi:hypothetical protein